MGDIKQKELEPGRDDSMRGREEEGGGVRQAAGEEMESDLGLKRSEQPLKRSLAARHMSMLALGGIIGPGLLVGSGTALATAGPVGAILSYLITGIVVFFTMQSLGELATYFDRSQDSLIGFCSRLIDPAAGAVMGYNYAILWMFVLANEYVSVATVIRYWEPAQVVPVGGYIAIFWVAFLLFSMMGVLAYGEAEFWLASIKILFLVVFFILSIVVNVGGTGTHDYIGFRYFQNPGSFVGDSALQRFSNIAKIFALASTQYSGVEMVAVTASEAKRPERAVPKAIRSVFWRILLFYLGTVFFVSLNVPYTDPNLLSASSKAASSPLTIALQRGGISAAANVINAFIIISVLSAGNSSLYVASRTICILARKAMLPKFMGWTTPGSRVPVPALIFSNCVALISLMSVSSGAGKAFTYVYNISGVCTFIVWGLICLASIRFRSAFSKQSNRSAKEELPFQALFYPYGAYFALALK